MFILPEDTKEIKKNEGDGAIGRIKDIAGGEFQRRRKENFRLQGKIQAELVKEGYKNRVTGCLKSPLSSIYIGKSANGKASYGNVLTCGNVWLCPCCAEKISRKREIEVCKAIEWAYDEMNYKVVMLTFTHEHTRGERLADLRRKHAEALRKFKSGRVWQEIKKKVGYEGCITGNEVTYGLNGWHWHSHMLLFVKHDIWMTMNEDVLKRHWINCLKKAGAEVKDENAMMEHGLDFLYDCHSKQYLTKMGRYWGAEKEITGGARKRGRGRSPFELADGTKKERALFMEYAKAVSLGNRCNQLVWSKGLKKKVGIIEKTDEELAAEKEENEILGYLSMEEWKLILKYKARAEVLSIAEKDGFVGVVQWLEGKWAEERKSNKVA